MKVFIAGPRAIKSIDKEVEVKLNEILTKNITVIVGDANGIDKSIQSHFAKLKYNNVIVYASEGKARNNVGNWKVENVMVEKGLKGFDYYKQKDVKMSQIADYGLMIWNGKSKGTLNNIINLVKENKKALVYFTINKNFACLDSIDKIEKLIEYCPEDTKILYNKLLDQSKNKPLSLQSQITLFDI